MALEKVLHLRSLSFQLRNHLGLEAAHLCCVLFVVPADHTLQGLLLHLGFQCTAPDVLFICLRIWALAQDRGFQAFPPVLGADC